METKEAWINQNWYVSPWNFTESVRNTFAPPMSVKVHDVTLRDGEQQSGVVFTKDDKIRIAESLAELGVHRIEAGMPAVSPDDEAAIREIYRRNLGPEIFSFCRAMPDDVKCSADCGVKGVVIEAPVNELFVKHGYNWSFDQALEKAVAATRCAQELGLYTVYFTIDGSRAEEQYYFDFIERVAKEGHMDSLVIVDTFSGLSPQATAQFVRTVKSRVNVPLEIHAHNGFGMAVANTCAAVMAGAEVIHTTIGGIGEGAGNCPMEETTLALLAMYGIDCGLHHEKYREVYQKVHNIAGSDPNRPFVGDMSYALEIGVGANTYRKIRSSNPPTLAMQCPIVPEFVGQSSQTVVLGKKSGIDNVEVWAERLGIPITKEEARMAVTLVKEKSTQEKRLLTENEFLEIIQEVK